MVFSGSAKGPFDEPTSLNKERTGRGLDQGSLPIQDNTPVRDDAASRRKPTQRGSWQRRLRASFCDSPQDTAGHFGHLFSTVRALHLLAEFRRFISEQHLLGPRRENENAVPVVEFCTHPHVDVQGLVAEPAHRKRHMHPPYRKVTILHHFPHICAPRPEWTPRKTTDRL
eukprot:CAMPEP_0174361164 /NCGR_PEP_ID=MMETSP0811_2-20130205/57860_1 /TAXON_ID=73025 ORGANISM="Eutreptiella gymnastica-like, Strain CCMP1594" /NCGR_SAMPLE_ID=MMETSP0811_2 /ASSEMBLY_ACC=CAM_ASM_000667 /LENGTH=169 /DNA_ID=CAMNT_0015497579 /DNA_START=174 /DNA_END=684 /DNA_ORIENTATION=-